MEHTPIYLDVDDDITAIVKKIGEADGKGISLVAPKRSSVLQSVVNQKLIKKAAASSGKSLAIISEDSKVKIIAGGLGLATAPNLRTTPVVAALEKHDQELPSDVIEETPNSDSSAQKAAPLAAGVAAGTAAANKKAKNAYDSSKPGKGKKIPDFGRFKKKTLIGILIAVGVIAVLVLMFFFLPSANVVVVGRTETQPVNFVLTVDTTADSPNYDQQVLPGTTHQLDKTLSGNFKTTGKKDVGTKASGTVSVKNCEDTDSRALSAGTSFTASNGKVYKSTGAATVPGGEFSGGGSTCKSDSVSIAVAASQTGDSYNIDATAYSSTSLSGNFVMSGSQMSGGSSKTVGVVTQSDVDTAKNQLLNNEKNNSQKELSKQFQDSDYIIEGSFTQTVGDVTSSPSVGGEGDSASLTVKVAYSEFAVKQNDINELLNKQAATAAQSRGTEGLAVIDNGLSSAKFTPAEKVTTGVQKFNVKTTATLGPNINYDELKKALKGKSYSASLDKIKSYPNVNDAQIHFSPFYVSKMPLRTGNIHIKIDTPKAQ